MLLRDFIVHTLEDYNVRVNAAIEPLTSEEMGWKPDPEANSIAFTYWYVARIEDDRTNAFAKGEAGLWLRESWGDKLALSDLGSGFGYSPEQVANFPNLPKYLLQAYFAFVRKETLEFLDGLQEGDFDRVPGKASFPEEPGTVSCFGEFFLARMYCQLIGEEDQQAGQISYVRGLQRGLGK
jgi:hypothetical protein